MKKNILLFCSLILFISFGNSQTKILKNIEGSKLLNSGVMLDNDNSANGYYFFYELDKVSKKEREFSVKILDQNLNEVLNKSFIEDRNCFLSEVQYNKKQLMFRMYNIKDFKYIFYSLDKAGNLNRVYEYEEGIKNYILHRDSPNISGVTTAFYPIENKGFLFFMTTKAKKFGYRLQYIASDGGENWTYVSNKDQHETIEFVDVGKEGIIIKESIRKKIFSKNYEFNIKVLKPETGDVIFKKEHPKDEDIIKMWNDAFIHDEKLVIVGEYWDKGDRPVKDDSKGICIDKYTFSGEKIFNKQVSWKDNFEQSFNSLNDESGKNYLFFHDFITTKNGHIYALAEQYRKTLKVGIGSQLTITDAYILDFDKEFNLIDVRKFDKGKSRIKSSVVSANRHVLALLSSREGDFDYEYTQIDKKNDRFYSLFLDYDRLKGEEDKAAFKAIIYNNGKLTEDKIYLEKGSVETKVKAAKTGYVLLVDYDKKKKEVKLHLEKLNIE